jgi:hypothetical protein
VLRRVCELDSVDLARDVWLYKSVELKSDKK